MATQLFLGGRILLGTEYSGYKIGIFEAGTSTPKTTYTDSALTAGNENTHPVVLDSNGAAQIWFSGNAKAIFYTSADVVVYTDDNINLEASASTATGASNLVLNGSFEDDTDSDDIPDNWTRTLYTSGTFTYDSANQYNGTDSVKFTSAGTGGGYITSTSNFSVSPSTVYTVGFALKSSVADVRNTVDILWYKYDGSASATASTSIYDDSTTNPTGWTKKWYTTTSPSDAAFAKIRLTGCHSSDATTGSTWFDDVVVTEYYNTSSQKLGNSIWFAEGTSLAAAGTTNIWQTDGNTRHITGAGTVSSFGTAAQAGAYADLIIDGTVSFVHDGTAIIGPRGNSVTAYPNDKFRVYAETTTSARIINHSRYLNYNFQYFNTTGTYTFTARHSGEHFYELRGGGGGGGGGGNKGTTSGAAGGPAQGGRGGAFIHGVSTLTYNETVVIIVGALGTGAGSGDASGGVGGNTTFGTYGTASGGAGGDRGWPDIITANTNYSHPGLPGGGHGGGLGGASAQNGNGNSGASGLSPGAAGGGGSGGHNQGTTANSGGSGGNGIAGDAAVFWK